MAALLYLLAVGLVLIFGLREVVNFAHGALFMVGAYIGFSLAAAGYLVGRRCSCRSSRWRDRRRRHRCGGLSHAAQTRPMVTVLVTFGILLILETLVTVIWGKAYLRYPMPAICSTAP